MYSTKQSARSGLRARTEREGREWLVEEGGSQEKRHPHSTRTGRANAHGELTVRPRPESAIRTSRGGERGVSVRSMMAVAGRGSKVAPYPHRGRAQKNACGEFTQ